MGVADQCRSNLLYPAFAGLPRPGPTPDDTALVAFRRRLVAALERDPGAPRPDLMSAGAAAEGEPRRLRRREGTAAG